MPFCLSTTESKLKDGLEVILVLGHHDEDQCLFEQLGHLVAVDFLQELNILEFVSFAVIVVQLLAVLFTNGDVHFFKNIHELLQTVKLQILIPILIEKYVDCWHFRLFPAILQILNIDGLGVLLNAGKFLF